VIKENIWWYKILLTRMLHVQKFEDKHVEVQTLLHGNKEKPLKKKNKHNKK
jgi:hypothetical protein